MLLSRVQDSTIMCSGLIYKTATFKRVKEGAITYEEYSKND